MTLTVTLAAALLVLAPATAQADFGIVPGSFGVQMLDGDGNPETRAGANPDRLAMQLAFNRLSSDRADGTLRDAKFHFPRGLVGNTNVIPRCDRETLTGINYDEVCPPESQIGEATVDAGLTITLPIYNVEPRPGNVAEFGFGILHVAIFLAAKIEADGRLVVTMSDTLQETPVAAIDVEVWGVPADHLPGEMPRRALLTTPARCGVPLEVSVSYRSWEEPDAWQEAKSGLPPFHGCEDLPFDPGLELALERTSADTPTGAEFGVTLPPEAGAGGRSNDRVKDMSLVLPDGMTLALGIANTLELCPERAVGLDDTAPDSCPRASRVGTLEMTTPLLDKPAAGNVYMGGQLPNDDLRLYAVAHAPGLTVKLPITMRSDPVTGRLTTTIEDMPPVPLDDLRLRFDGGARSALVTPLRCGPAIMTATLTSHGGKRTTVSAGAAVTNGATGGPCPPAPPFDPSFLAGTLRAKAGANSPFVATIRRSDGDQSIGRFSLTMPKGVVARLAVADRCPEAAIALNACPESSRVGTAATEAGAGPTPLIMRGNMYLTGPYRTTRPFRQAPVGLAIVVGGAAGPFDLGAIVVRTGMRLDPRGGRVSIDSGPVPQVANGFPLRMQTLAIDIDRPGFSSNPTSCKPSEAEIRLESVEGAVAKRTSRFAVGGCRKLSFQPRISMALTGRSELRRDGHPGLRMRIRSATVGANLSSATVSMPALLAGSPVGPAAICSLRQVESGRCPDAARIGRTSARTPLLKRPLRGSVYLVQPPRKGLPDIWAVLRGQGMELRTRMRTVRGDDGRISGEIVDLPDVPLDDFTIAFAGGKRGMFVAKRSPCADGRARPIRASARMKGHNGAARRLALRVAVSPGCPR